MKIVGLSYSLNDDGSRKNTIYVITEFDSYFSGADGKRGCIGNKTESIYAGDYDCSMLKPGMSIEVSYDKAITTRNGVFQPIKKIEIVNNVKQT